MRCGASARGSRLWTGLLEAKTGAGTHTREQLENYLDVAKKNKYDVVISLSNDLPAGAGELPVEVDKRKLTKVALRHLSWAEVIHEARMVLSHGGIDNPLQGWILSEFLRYIEHPKSGAAEFVDMGRHWVSIRDSVSAGTLRPGDPKAAAVAQSWIALARNLALRFTADLGVVVKHVLPRRVVNDADARTALTVNELANDGTFSATLRIPDAAGELRVTADLRTNKVSCSTTVSAPDEGTSGKRVTWVLRQLKNAPAELLVEALFTGPASSTCETVASARTTPRLLTDSQGGQLSSFVLTQSFTLGSKRSGTAASFINSVTSSAEIFYSEVVQPLREWVPAARRRPISLVKNKSTTKTDNERDSHRARNGRGRRGNPCSTTLLLGFGSNLQQQHGHTPAPRGPTHGPSLGSGVDCLDRTTRRPARRGRARNRGRNRMADRSPHGGTGLGGQRPRPTPLAARGTERSGAHHTFRAVHRKQEPAEHSPVHPSGLLPIAAGPQPHPRSRLPVQAERHQLRLNGDTDFCGEHSRRSADRLAVLT